MKRVVPIMGLYVRSSIYRILGVLAAMIAVEAAVFHDHLQRAADVANLELDGTVDYTLDGIWNLGLWQVCAVAFLVVTVLLCLPGCSFSTRTEYTLGRLSCNEKEIFLAQATVNLLFYLIFWGVQVLAVFGLCRYYAFRLPEACTGQTVFLAFYRSDYLHSLLPLADWLLWLRNLLLVLALSVSAADFSRRQRRTRRIMGVVIPLSCVAALFSRCGVGKTGNASWMSLVSGICLAVVLIRLFCAEEGEQDA